jgi:hypothetical protein
MAYTLLYRLFSLTFLAIQNTSLSLSLSLSLDLDLDLDLDRSIDRDQDLDLDVGQPMLSGVLMFVFFISF